MIPERDKKSRSPGAQRMQENEVDCFIDWHEESFISSMMVSLNCLLNIIWITSEGSLNIELYKLYWPMHMLMWDYLDCVSWPTHYGWHHSPDWSPELWESRECKLSIICLQYSSLPLTPDITWLAASKSWHFCFPDSVNCNLELWGKWTLFPLCFISQGAFLTVTGSKTQTNTNKNNKTKK